MPSSSTSWRRGPGMRICDIRPLAWPISSCTRSAPFARRGALLADRATECKRWEICHCVHGSAADLSCPQTLPIANTFLSKIKHAFFDSLYFSLDCLAQLSLSDEAKMQESGDKQKAPIGDDERVGSIRPGQSTGSDSRTATGHALYLDSEQPVPAEGYRTTALDSAVREPSESRNSG